MRLLNVRTHALRDFDKLNIPPYAILSHTWSREEVTFQDLVIGKAEDRKGYEKLAGCCTQAIKDGFDYVWIDTCCIDKTSSAELTEAINSMFNWYRDAEVCYAYLEDVGIDKTRDHSTANFSRSRWFTRGWTLQELIAPPRLIFLGGDWVEIGARQELVETVARVTGIDRAFFDHGTLNRYSIAQRMSWVAYRKTTRVEDVAYCLLGIFGVTMPLLYGEGEMAFIRLQEEIMRRSDDHSIFAWTANKRLGADEVSGLLATSPADFADAAGIMRIEKDHKLPPYSITNKGIQITLPIIKPEVNHTLPFIPSGTNKEYGAGGVTFAFTTTSTLAILSCKQPSTASDHPLGLISVPAEDSEKHSTLDTILVRASEPRDGKPLWPGLKAEQLVIIKGLPPPSSGFRLEKKFPETLDGPDSPKWITSEAGAIAVRLGRQGSMGRVGLLFTNESRRGFCLFIEPDDEMIWTELLVNLDEALIESLEQLARIQRGAGSKISVRRIEQETSKGQFVVVRVEAKMRPHGALVWIDIEAAEPVIEPVLRKRSSLFQDVGPRSLLWPWMVRMTRAAIYPSRPPST